MKIDLNQPEHAKLDRTYNLNSLKNFASLFLSQDGILLHSYNTVSSSYKEYLRQIDEAFLKAGEALKINQIEQEYNTVNHNFGVLEVLLMKRKQLHLATDSL